MSARVFFPRPWAISKLRSLLFVYRKTIAVGKIEKRESHSRNTRNDFEQYETRQPRGRGSAPLPPLATALVCLFLLPRRSSSSLVLLSDSAAWRGGARGCAGGGDKSGRAKAKYKITSIGIVNINTKRAGERPARVVVMSAGYSPFVRGHNARRGPGNHFSLPSPPPRPVSRRRARPHRCASTEDPAD